MKKIQIQTFGCKVNQFESASFHSRFQELGHHIVSAGSGSDIIVINTCSVTGKAGAQSRQAIRKAVRDNSNAKIVITGCYSQMAGNELETMPELKDKSVCIIGNGDKHFLVDAALSEDFVPITSPSPLAKATEISPLPIRNFGNRTRAYLRIQDGCNSYCSYCIVPFTRGRSRSLPLKEVLNQAAVFADEGYREIVITGIHVGNYGLDLTEDIDISKVMERLCRATPQIRYRLSSIEPTEISKDLLSSMAQNSNFMPHLHIPLQSGNDDILLRMNRRYTTNRFAEIVDLCRKTIKDVAIGIDILAGFPGETNTHFSSTLSFLEDLDFTYLHVFPYSKRPGTPAADFPDQIAGDRKDFRVKTLRQLSDKKKEMFYLGYIGDIRPVLVEGKRNSMGLLKGFTDNYIPVSFSGENIVRNSVVQVQLEKADATTISGRIVKTENER
jgi:threonylcarbamoyladenosine tRNA methylthiotransferase MtaB